MWGDGDFDALCTQLLIACAAGYLLATWLVDVSLKDSLLARHILRDLLRSFHIGFGVGCIVGSHMDLQHWLEKLYRP